MRQVRIRDPAGSVRNGIWTERGIEYAGEIHDPEAVEILPPVEPTKIVCLGGNYLDHLVNDAGRSKDELPDRPPLFFKTPNTVSAHRDTITLPSGKDQVEQEAEIGVVIGQQARNVAADDAMEYVRGFTCVNDLSNRDDQMVEQNWVRGKAFDNAAPIGPVIATPDEVPADAKVESRVNGEIQQRSTREHLLFTVPEIIEEVTRLITLEPDDIIATGTPEGPGPLSNGDEVKIEIEGVGTLRNSVVRRE